MWKYDESEKQQRQDDMDVNNMQEKGIYINRGAIRLSIGGIYRQKDTNQEYQLVEFVDANQGLFKNLQTLKVQLLSIHQFDNIHDENHAVSFIDKKRGWQEGNRRINITQEQITEDVIQGFHLFYPLPKGAVRAMLIALVLALILFVMNGVGAPTNPILGALWNFTLIIISVICLLSMIYAILKAY